MAIITVKIRPEKEGEPKGMFKYQVGGKVAGRIFANALVQAAHEEKRAIGKIKKFVKAE